MSVPQSLLELAPSEAHGDGWRYPPTVFTHMSRDKRTAVGVPGDMEVLEQKVSMYVWPPARPWQQ